MQYIRICGFLEFPLFINGSENCQIVLKKEKYKDWLFNFLNFDEMRDNNKTVNIKVSQTVQS